MANQPQYTALMRTGEGETSVLKGLQDIAFVALTATRPCTLGTGGGDVGRAVDCSDLLRG
jgi:hypothetical protein